jgi:uncharacterized membrane protein YozB (DUF420 family)/cytochrome oxidase Cu insertion factor (SCO1/SenC/PrrC family)
MIGNATSRKGMTTFQMLLGSVLWGCVLAAFTWVMFAGKRSDGLKSGAGILTALSKSDEQSSNTVKPEPDSVKISFPARELPNFDFPECMGGTVSRDGLKGKPWIASFVFTRCVTTCPMITREMMELHRRVEKTSPDVKFVSFSVDSSYDTADVLKKYAEIFSADHERWKFVTGDEQKIHDLIREGFTLAVMPNLGSERKPGFEVAHTNRVVLVNEDSIPVATFLATNPEDIVRLRRILEGKEEFPKPGPALVTGAGSVAPGSDIPAKVNIPSGDQAAASDDAPEADASTETGNGETAGTEKAVSGNTEGDDAAAPAINLQLKRVDTPEESSNTGTTPGPVTEPKAPETDLEKVQRIDRVLPDWSKPLPRINAMLNGSCTLLLILGYVAIRKRNVTTHRNLMILAFLVSTAFLCSYLLYHAMLGKFTAVTGARLHGRPFLGSPAATTLYYGILIPHVILAAFVPILAIRVFWLAFAGRLEKHRKLAKITLPIWLFVSVTGVLIYLMLYQWPWQNVSVS